MQRMVLLAAVVLLFVLSRPPGRQKRIGGVMNSQPRDPVESITAKYFLEHRLGQI
jgi:hypothetical protein